MPCCLYVVRRYRERNGEAWLQKPRTVVGICTGNLAALAAVMSFSDGDILRLGPIMIPISLRLGIEVSQRSHALEVSTESWSVGVSGITLETIKDELRQFNDSRVGCCLLALCLTILMARSFSQS